MRKDRFTDEALRNAYALGALKYSENPGDQQAFAEAYDYATCERPDGSKYGTGGTCRKGKEVAPNPAKGSPVGRDNELDKQVVSGQKEAARIKAARGPAPAEAPRPSQAELLKRIEAQEKAEKEYLANQKKPPLTREEYEKRMAAMQAKGSPSKAKPKKSAPKNANEALDALATRANRAKATGTYVNKSTLEKMIKLADETGRKIKYERMLNGNFNVYVQKGS